MQYNGPRPEALLSCPSRRPQAVLPWLQGAGGGAGVEGGLSCPSQPSPFVPPQLSHGCQGSSLRGGGSFASGCCSFKRWAAEWEGVRAPVRPESDPINHQRQHSGMSGGIQGPLPLPHGQWGLGWDSCCRVGGHNSPKPGWEQALAATATCSHMPPESSTAPAPWQLSQAHLDQQVLWEPSTPGGPGAQAEPASASPRIQ